VRYCHSPMRRGAALAGALAAIAIAAGAATPATSAQVSAATAPAACGQSLDAKPVIHHVIVIVMENHSYSEVIGHAPFITAMAKRCGLATNYHAITHPSLPNYLALTSGSIHGIHSDCQPQSCSIGGPNIFSQLSRHGLRWRSYAESMPSPCDRGSNGLYAARHVPAVYYVRVRAQCGRHVRSLGRLASGRLHHALHSGHAPAYMFVTPNLCNDMHDCSVATGDRWAARWIPMIVASRTYRHGHTAILLVWDEGGANHNQVALIAISRYTRPHTVSSRAMTHFSLLRASERLLGIRRYLGKANSSRGLPKAFHL
jgi:phosphatidylinositol-3-phosphatase